MTDRNEREIKALREKYPQGARIVGLTGGVSSGKTVATDALKAEGYNIVDADEISRRLVSRGSALEQTVKDNFPECTRDGELDRRALRALISESPAAKHKLNKLTHPEIIKATEAAVQAAPKPVVLCAPLLFECALARLCDCVVCVTCPQPERVRRLTLRDGVSCDDAIGLIRSQLDEPTRVSLSDFCVPSDIPQNEFIDEITVLFKRITDFCHPKRSE